MKQKAPSRHNLDAVTEGPFVQSKIRKINPNEPCGRPERRILHARSIFSAGAPASDFVRFLRRLKKRCDDFPALLIRAERDKKGIFLHPLSQPERHSSAKLTAFFTGNFRLMQSVFQQTRLKEIQLYQKDRIVFLR